MSQWLNDVRAVTTRNIIRAKRTPDVIVFAVLQPIMFVVLFSQVFGGAINVPGTDYTNFLMAGIFAQTAIFGATFSGMFMVQDKKDGLIDRFRTLPMSNSAVVFARTFTDLLLNAVSLLVMVLTGLAVGWRPDSGIGGFLAGYGLLLIFSWSFSWGPGVAGTDGEVRGGDELRDIHGSVPIDVPLQRLRAQRQHAQGAAGLRGMEPCVFAGAGHASAVRQPG